MNANKYVRIYLGNHLTMLSALTSVAKRSHRSNQSSEFATTLERLKGNFVDDCAYVEAQMEALGVRRGLKKGLGSAAQKFGALKLNGHLTSYSPLSRVIEFETITAGVSVRRQMLEFLQKHGTENDLSQRIERCLEDDELIRAAYRRAVELIPR